MGSLKKHSYFHLEPMGFEPGLGHQNKSPSLLLPYRLEHSPRRLLILGGPKLGFYLEQATIRV